jgi:hypothetical protein
MKGNGAPQLTAERGFIWQDILQKAGTAGLQVMAGHLSMKVMQNAINMN